MSFPCDGSNHKKSIQSEYNLINYEEQIEDFYGKKIIKILSSKESKKYGGAKNKIDNLIIFDDGEELKISLKNKESIYTGSYDYANLSKINGLSETKKIYEQYRYTNLDKEDTYNILKKSINLDILNLTSEEITEYFCDNVYKKYIENDIKLFIIDEKENKIYCDVEPLVFKLMKENGKIHIKYNTTKNEDQCSYGLYGVDQNGNDVDIYLRIRIHLNNGATLWLNKTKNKTSQLCMKFQQDSVYRILI